MVKGTRSRSALRAANPAWVDVSFFADGTMDRWAEIARKLGMSDGDGDDSDTATFVAVPQEIVPGALYLVGGFHPTTEKPEDSKRVHWHLNWLPIPDGSPPPALIEMSAGVGGYPGVLSRLRGLWRGPTNVDMAFSVALVLVDACAPLERVTLRGKFSGELSADLPKTLEKVAWDGLSQAVGS